MSTRGEGSVVSARALGLGLGWGPPPPGVLVAHTQPPCCRAVPGLAGSPAQGGRTRAEERNLRVCGP